MTIAVEEGPYTNKLGEMEELQFREGKRYSLMRYN